MDVGLAAVAFEVRAAGEAEKPHSYGFMPATTDEIGGVGAGASDAGGRGTGVLHRLTQDP